jgi:hypothetical protein
LCQNEALNVRPMNDEVKPRGIITAMLGAARREMLAKERGAG